MRHDLLLPASFENRNNQLLAIVEHLLKLISIQSSSLLKLISIQSSTKLLALCAYWMHTHATFRQEEFTQDPEITPTLVEAYHFARYATTVYGGTALVNMGIDERAPPGGGLM